MPDFSRYLPPGVYTDAVPGPQAGLQAANPNAVGIFGTATGYQTDSESLVIPADQEDTGAPRPTTYLRQRGVDLSTLTVRNVADGTLYQATTDYTVIPTNGPSGTTGPDTAYQIQRVEVGGTLAEGVTISVTYQYTNASYYTARAFYDLDDIVDAYGAPFNADGSVNSELTLAARFAMLNGASVIVCSPVSNSNSPSDNDYVAALDRFSGFPGISIVLCANGSVGTSVISSIKAHVSNQSDIKYERRAVLGLDGTTSSVNSETLQAQAKGIASARVALVSPASFNYFNGNLSQTVALGGQYAAAAIAGWVVSHSPEQPLTRKSLVGFASVDIAPETRKNNETQAGLMVIEDNVRVRHGVTTDPSSLFTREWSILGQQDAMAYAMRNYYDSDGLIGSPIDADTVPNIMGSSIAALESLVSSNAIVAYSDLKVRNTVNYPDVIEVSYSWRPSIPANYLVVRFSMNLSTGTFTTDNAA